MKKLFSLIMIATTLYSKHIVIDLKKQNLIVYDDNNTIVLKSSITSGRIGHETPRGVFKILDKERMHISNLYPVHEDGTKGGAKMPYMLRVTNGGVAIHAGEMVEYPDSHGCIRVPYGKAMQLFKMIEIGTKVTIKNRPPFTDKINQARLEEIKFKKEQKSYRVKYYKKKRAYGNSYGYDNKDIKWIKNAFSYYDDM
jgi:hypothetical protein